MSRLLGRCSVALVRGRGWVALLVAVFALGGGAGCGTVANKHPDAGGASGAGAGGNGQGGGSGGQDGGVTGQDGGVTGQGGGSAGQGAGGSVADGGLDQRADGDAADGSAPSTGVTAVSLGDVSVFAAVASTFTKVPYVSELFDDRNEFDTTNSRFTAIDAGDYQVCASLLSAPDVTHPFELDLYVNGARERALAGIGGKGFEQGCRVVRLAAGNYLEVWVYVEFAGPAVTFPSNPYWNWLTITKVSSTVAVRDISAFSAASTTFTKVPYVSEAYDDQNQFDTVNSRFTAAAAGDYQVCASLTSSPDLSHFFELDLYVNGVRENAFAGEVAGGNGFEHGCRVVRLLAGNFVEVWVYQNSGAAMAFAPNTNWNWMTVAKVAPTVSLDDTTGTLPVPTGTFTKVLYGSKLFDDQNQFDTATSRFTAADSGDYQICAALTSYPTAPSLGFELDLYINGARSTALSGVGAGGYQHGCRVVRLVAGNYVEVWVYQSSGATVSFSQNNVGNWLTATKVRP
jgi:hypothetical protein